MLCEYSWPVIQTLQHLCCSPKASPKEVLYGHHRCLRVTEAVVQQEERTMGIVPLFPVVNLPLDKSRRVNITH